MSALDVEAIKSRAREVADMHDDAICRFSQNDHEQAAHFARRHVPALCDEITRLRAENEKLHMALDTLGAQVSGFVANVVDDGSEAFAECVRIADVIQTTLMATDA